MLSLGFYRSGPAGRWRPIRRAAGDSPLPFPPRGPEGSGSPGALFAAGRLALGFPPAAVGTAASAAASGVADEVFALAALWKARVSEGLGGGVGGVSGSVRVGGDPVDAGAGHEGGCDHLLQDGGVSARTRVEGHHRYAEPLGEGADVDGLAVLLGDVRHGDDRHGGPPGLRDLGEEVEGPRHRASVEDDEYEVDAQAGVRIGDGPRRPADGVGDDLLVGARGDQRVRSGQVEDSRPDRAPVAGGHLHRRARGVDGALARTGDPVEERGLADVGVADEGDGRLTAGHRGDAARRSLGRLALGAAHERTSASMLRAERWSTATRDPAMLMTTPPNPACCVTTASVPGRTPSSCMRSMFFSGKSTRVSLSGVRSGHS